MEICHAANTKNVYLDDRGDRIAVFFWGHTTHTDYWINKYSGYLEERGYEKEVCGFAMMKDYGPFRIVYFPKHGEKEYKVSAIYVKEKEYDKTTRP